MSTSITWTQARRIALRAQGVGRARHDWMPSRRASRAALARTLEHTHLLQIDSVSVFARAHHMPVFTRAGVWDEDVLDRASRPGPSRLVHEALAHEAAFVTEQVHPLLDFRRRRAARRDWGAVRRAAAESPHVLEAILATIAEHGPISASAVSRLLGDDTRGEGWGWRRTSSQWVVEYLFRSGRLDCVGRSAQFERLYLPAARPPTLPHGDDLPESAAIEPATPEHTGERPSGHLADEADIRTLVSLAARALGIADIGAIADYFRLGTAEVEPAVADLVGEEALQEVRVRLPGGEAPMMLHRDAPRPAALRAAALVSPFDPIVFHRPRLRALFDVDYKIGIYTPAARRTTGYYSLLFLLGDVFPARVDLKADRARNILEVRGAFREPLPLLPERHRPADPEVVQALVPELQRAARWRGLDRIEVLTGTGTGELSEELKVALSV